ncbi:phospholipase D, partial [Meredithblackwellia eburnea MCA 4105]
WNVIRNRIKSVATPATKPKDLNKSLSGHELVTELATGVLPMVLVKMGMLDRDEHGEHRIPILMNYLKLRITDSIYPLHDRHAVFRIELEYGDGLVKWVIYRELKDFVNLHAHYRVANLRQGIEKFPAFPKTSFPYLNWLTSEGRGQVGKAEFARAQRDVLENYVLKLIRATMFGPGANRLCKFLEISAMSIQLAAKGGEQGKQGYLRIMSSGASKRKEQGFHPFSWTNRHEPKWFVVRDSYVLAVDDPASTRIYEVFMIDSTFTLERPKRIYRQGLNLFRPASDSEDDEVDDEEAARIDPTLRNEKPQGRRGAGDPLDPSATTQEDKDTLRDSSNHMFYLKSSERKLRLVAKTERQQDQFIASIEKMVARTIWAGKNRFESFAPIRLNASAQWLVDGRDYFWSLSRAIMMAKERIYIHDWWLSPELYLRRPSIDNEKWRLDRLLQRKAKEGVQIFVIVYKEVSNDFTPVDSNYTKTRLRALHPNIHIQRSPSHTSTGTLLWSHHEKMCVIDETIGFMGGLDLCFGRWDTPGHNLVDDARESAQIWPGKDYANSRVVDFHTLDKPHEDMYDRSKVPRQPWHDVGLQIIGQPARDLCRHFIQRWNYLLRTKNHTIDMPFLLPAPDFTARQLQDQRITGTCEVQICRSVGPWSMGITHIEHSIQNAYIKAIQLSDHFVYIENQFFITSTEVNGTIIENKIGDALVSRIVRAHSEGTKWRAIIIIPLVPGYPFPIDHSDAGSVRNIMECQNRTICRGEHSIFARLRREGIDPDEYISFFSLRGWGKLSTGALTTEAVYIHDKMMVVDDRIAIIGSANINERSQRGDRDSELACIIRDTDMIESTMGGEHYMVGRFAHTLRVRLMREHLGVDVDELEASDDDPDLLLRHSNVMKEDDEAWDPDHEQEKGQEKPSVPGQSLGWRNLGSSINENVKSMANGAVESVGIATQKAVDNISFIPDSKGGQAVGHGDPDEADEKLAKSEMLGRNNQGGPPRYASTVVPTVEEKVIAEGRPISHGRDISNDKVERAEAGSPVGATSSTEDRSLAEFGKTTQSGGLDDTRKIEGEGMDVKEGGEDVRPLAPITEVSRDQVPRIHDLPPPPDVKTAHAAGTTNGHQHLEPLVIPTGRSRSTSTSSSRTASTSADLRSPDSRSPLSPVDRSRANETSATRNTITSSLRRNLKERASAYNIPIPVPMVDPHGFSDPLTDKFYKDVWMAVAARNTQAFRKVFRCVPDDLVLTWKQYREFGTWAERHNKPPHSDPAHHSGQHGAGGGGSGGGAMGQGIREGESPPVETMHRSASRARSGSVNKDDKRVPSSNTPAGEGHDHDEGFPSWERDQMEECLNEVRGHLGELIFFSSFHAIVFPTRFLESESAGGNFLYASFHMQSM